MCAGFLEEEAMSTTAALESPGLTLEPGAAGSTRLTIRNDSEVVEEYSLRVVGLGESWAAVVPASVSLYPGHHHCTCGVQAPAVRLRPRR